MGPSCISLPKKNAMETNYQPATDSWILVDDRKIDHGLLQEDEKMVALKQANGDKSN